jgi:hypothetical protein
MKQLIALLPSPSEDSESYEDSESLDDSDSSDDSESLEFVVPKSNTSL